MIGEASRLVPPDGDGGVGPPASAGSTAAHDAAREIKNRDNDDVEVGGASVEGSTDSRKLKHRRTRGTPLAVALAAAVSLGLLLGLLFGGGTGTRAGGAAAAPDDSKTVIAPEEQLGLVQDVFHELGWKSTEFDVTYLMQCGRCAETKSLLVWDETSLPAGLTDR